MRGDVVHSQARHRAVARRPRWFAPVGVAYLCALVAIAFWPTLITEPIQAILRAAGRLIPGTTGGLELAANILLFIPAGLLIALLLPPRLRWLAVVAAVATSIAVEMSQGILLPGRVATAADVVANTAGAVIGMLCAARWDRRPLRAAGQRE